jgi:hypothetical protein
MADRDALSIHFPDGESMRVGNPWASGRTARKDDPPITRITVSDDLPGMYCNMERARVWVGDRCVFEAPLHNLEGVEYPMEERQP